MKFNKLLLRAYGPFTDRVLDFQAAAPAGLHLVYGPNEAGKSSSLRATVALLFGIPRQTADDFVHDYADLRVGAVLETADGRRLSLMRRKAIKQPVWTWNEDTGTEEAPADEADLKALTAGLDQPLFESMFGIDHERLRRGGEQLLAGEGELGASLFQAGSGLANVRLVLGSLEAEARTRFVPKGQNPVINAALKDFEERRRQQREHTLRPREWQEQRQAADAAARRVEELSARLRALQAEQGRLQRLRATLPQAARLAALQAELAALGDTPELPTDAAERRLRAETGRDRAQLSLAATREDLFLLRARRAALRPDARLLPQADAIARLHHDAEAMALARRDEAVQQAELARIDEALRLVAARIDARTDAHDLAASLPGAAAATVLRDAAAALRGALQATADTRQRLQAAQSLHDRCRVLHDALPRPRDVQALAAALAFAQALGDVDDEIAAATARVAEAQARVDDGARGLGSADPAALRQAVPPPAGEAESLAARLATLRAERERLDAEADRLGLESARLETERARLEATGEVVTAATLAAVRDARDARWRAFRDAPVPDAAGPVEALIVESDRQADLLRADAERAARFAALDRALAANAARIDEIEARRAGLRLERDALSAPWQARLQATGLGALEPEAFVRWHARRDAWLEQCKALDEARSALARRVAQREAAADTLREALQHAGGRAGRDLPLALLLQETRQRLATEQARTEALAQAVRQEDDALRALDAARLEDDAAQARLLQTEADWAQALLPLNLPAEASPAVAEIRLQHFDEAERLLLQRRATAEALARHAAGRQARTIALEALAERLDMPAPSPADEAGWLAGLHAAAQAAREQAAQAQALDARIEDARVRETEQAQALALAQAELGRLRVQAGCDTDEALPGLEARAGRVRELRAAVADLQAALVAAADRPLDVLLEEATGQDPDEVAARLATLSDEADALQAALESARQERLDREHRLSLLDGTDQAATAREAAEAALARVRAEAMNYARARLAHTLLDQALAAWQQRAQGPMIEGASRLFALLTEDRYLRLRVEDDDERRVLVAERADGATRRIAQLSEGTRDALYLALRLAALDLHLGGNPRMPLILDDILVNFDDRRSAATLRALADVSARTQVLLFTHHEHLVEVARRTLSDDVLAVHRL